MNKVQVHFFLTKKQAEKLNKLSQFFGRSKSDLIREGLFLIFEKYEKILIEGEDSNAKKENIKR